MISCWFALIFNRKVRWGIGAGISPGHNPRKKSLSLMIIFTLFTLLFSPLATHMGPYWAHMDPYGPVYHFILLLYELNVVFTLFLYDFRLLYTWFLRCLTYLENSFYTYVFITFLYFPRIISVVLRPEIRLIMQN